MRLSACALFAVLASTELSARAQEATVTKQACVDAYRDAQPLSRTGKLTKAREHLLLCARDPCPKVLQPDCVQWLDDVEQRMPSIIVTLRDTDGRDLPEAELTIDGVVVAPRLDGRAIEIDPGEHTVSVKPSGHDAIVQPVVATEREKGRKVIFDLPSQRGTTPETPVVIHRPVPWTFWTAVGVGGAGLASFGFFGARGLSERSDLESCSPTCSDHRLVPTRTNFLVADVSLAVAVIAAGAATFIWFTRSPERVQTASYFPQLSK